MWWRKLERLYQEEEKFLKQMDEVKENDKKNDISEVFQKFFQKNTEDDLKSIIKDAENVIPYLKRAIKSFECKLLLML